MGAQSEDGTWLCVCVCVCAAEVWEIDLAADGSMCGHCGTVASLGGAGTLGLTGRLGSNPAASTHVRPISSSLEPPPTH